MDQLLPFSCDTCSSRFAHQAYLKVHQANSPDCSVDIIAPVSMRAWQTWRSEDASEVDSRLGVETCPETSEPFRPAALLQPPPPIRLPHPATSPVRNNGSWETRSPQKRPMQSLSELSPAEEENERFIKDAPRAYYSWKGTLLPGHGQHGSFNQGLSSNGNSNGDSPKIFCKDPERHAALVDGFTRERNKRQKMEIDNNRLEGELHQYRQENERLVVELNIGRLEHLRFRAERDQLEEELRVLRQDLEAIIQKSEEDVANLHWRMGRKLNNERSARQQEHHHCQEETGRLRQHYDTAVKSLTDLAEEQRVLRGQWAFERRQNLERSGVIEIEPSMWNSGPQETAQNGSDAPVNT